MHRGHVKEERGVFATSYIKTEDSRHRMYARGFGLQSKAHLQARNRFNGRMQQYVHPEMPTVVYTPEQVPLSEINASKITPASARCTIGFPSWVLWVYSVLR